jgi:hypothetical protein
VKYNGYDEISSFITNWSAVKWYWTSRYRAKAITGEDLQEDIEQQAALDDYYGLPKSKEGKIQSIINDSNLSMEEKMKLIDSINAEFEGYESVHSMHEVIELSDKDMVYFD